MMKHLLTILAILMVISAGCAVSESGETGVEQEPPTLNVPSTPYVICAEVFEYVQECYTRPEMEYKEPLALWAFHAGDFTRGHYINTRIDILNPVSRPIQIYAEIVYDDNCRYGTIEPDIKYPLTLTSLEPGEVFTILTDAIGCAGIGNGEHLITVKLWGEFLVPLETIMIGFTLIN